jgi:type II secretory pathway pseudopilin PulG
MAELIHARGKAKASTILETIVAMVIITTIFGIAIFVFVRSGLTATSQKKMKAEQVLKLYATKTRLQGEFFDTDEQIDSFEVKRQVVSLNEFSKLWRIHFFVYDPGHVLLAQWQQDMLATQ